jgi:CRP-like cAMP-binding protein
MKVKHVPYNTPLANEGEKIFKLYIIVVGVVKALQLKQEDLQ